MSNDKKVYYVKRKVLKQHIRHNLLNTMKEVALRGNIVIKEEYRNSEIIKVCVAGQNSYWENWLKDNSYY